MANDNNNTFLLSKELKKKILYNIKKFSGEASENVLEFLKDFERKISFLRTTEEETRGIIIFCLKGDAADTILDAELKRDASMTVAEIKTLLKERYLKPDNVITAMITSQIQGGEETCEEFAQKIINLSETLVQAPSKGTILDWILRGLAYTNRTQLLTNNIMEQLFLMGCERVDHSTLR